MQWSTKHCAEVRKDYTQTSRTISQIFHGCIMVVIVDFIHHNAGKTCTLQWHAFELNDSKCKCLIPHLWSPLGHIRLTPQCMSIGYEYDKSQFY